MDPAVSLSFGTFPDLDATMDIQIPALAWQPTEPGRWQRTYYVNGQTVDVQLDQEDDQLRFVFETDRVTAQRLRKMLAEAFPTGEQIADLTLDAHPILKALRRRYAGVIVMTAPAFEALVLTVLSQNRSGTTVRQVFPGWLPQREESPLSVSRRCPSKSWPS